MPSFGSAVVGTGFIGPAHVEALRRLGRDVVGVLGSSPEKSAAAAERLKLRKGYESYEDLLSDPDVRVVHLASPNRHHFQQAKQAINAGKHVVCEKPLAMTALESAELAALEMDASVVTAVCYNVRFYPLCLHARRLVTDGTVGDVFHVTGSYLQDWLLYETDFNWRVSSAKGGELRAVADIGTHWLDLIVFITGLEIESVCADLRTVHEVRRAPTGSVETFQSGDNTVRARKTRKGQGRGWEAVTVETEDYGSVLFRFSNGAAGAVTVSQVTAGRKNCIRFDLAGRNASLAWDSEEPNVLSIGHRDRSNERLTRDPALLGSAEAMFASYPGGHAEGFPDTFKQFFRAVYAAIEAREEGREHTAAVPYPTFADGHREIMLCEAIMQSHRERRWVDV